jgi:hypothetical protein
MRDAWNVDTPRQFGGNTLIIVGRWRSGRHRVLCRKAKMQRALFVVAILAAAEVNCAQRAKTAPEPDPLVERLASPPLRDLQTTGFRYAFATPTCGATDGPAVALYLLDERSDAVPSMTTKYIRVKLDGDPALRAHSSINWRESRGPQGVLCSGGSCVALNEGRIHFGAVKPGKSVEGELCLRFTDGSQIRKRFHAHWRPSRFICG